MTASKTPPAEEAPSYTVPGSTAEYGDGLTGFEEIAITSAFGAPIAQLGDRDPMLGIRALIFCHRRREGEKDKPAKDYAMGLTRLEASRYFEHIGAAPDLDPDDPDTPEGKDATPAA
jgi:hypothetical protein